MLNPDLEKLPQLASQAKPRNQKLLAKIKRKKPKNLDATVSEIHDEVFEEIDCLDCANCCKTTSPTFYNRDIERLAKHLKQTPAEFTEKFLHIDEDDDYVLNSAPCTFLGSDNYCSVYEARPDACRQYPHTKRRKFHQVLSLTLKNTFICPAAYRIVEQLGKVYQ